ncbi:MAG: sulfur carrier protein ThiS [Marinifilaceae bacterium]
MIKVYINDHEITIQATSTLSDALASSNVDAVQCAVAINQRIVSRAQWDTTSLTDGDKILIIKAVQGG